MKFFLLVTVIKNGLRLKHEQFANLKKFANW